jgi:hypothetical protein
MRLEQFPIVLGVVFCLLAAGIIYDAVSPEQARPFRERRRRRRAELNKTGEWFVALGTVALGAALIGREDWRWGTVAILAGVGLLIIGGILNRDFLREMLLFRGAARRTEEMEVPPDRVKKDEPKLRIR